jgi:hypothetical protein
MEVSFEVTPAEHDAIMKIVDRYAAFVRQMLGQPTDRLNLMMDLTACHANGNPLRLDELAATADDFSFMHDVGGIRRHIDRDTGKLTGLFSPRFSRRELVAGEAA